MSHFAGSPALTAVQFVDEVGLAMSGSTSADADAVNDADDDGGGGDDSDGYHNDVNDAASRETRKFSYI